MQILCNISSSRTTEYRFPKLYLLEVYGHFVVQSPVGNSVNQTLLNRLRMLPFFWLSLAFLAGIVLSSQISLTYDIWIILAGIFLLFALRPRKLAELFRLSTKTYLIIVLSLVSFCLGGMDYQLHLPKIDAFHIAWYNDRE